MGDRLAKARNAAGYSQSELADFFGMSRVTLSRYETGAHPAPLYILRLWAMHCHVPLDWLRYGDSPPRPDVVAELPRTRRAKKGATPSTKWYPAVRFADLAAVA
jgi:transcriptional regulator with XRE-family HTH domain